MKIMSGSQFKEIYCIPDGLDECPESPRAQLLDIIGQCLARRPKFVLKVLVASRPYDNIRIQMESL
jgi:hypothetical protein